MGNELEKQKAESVAQKTIAQKKEQAKGGMKNPYLASVRKHVQTEVRKSMVSDMLKIMIPPVKK